MLVKEKWVRGETIGRGSCGTVSLGVNKSSDEVFAVKSVEKSVSGNCSFNTYQLEALENEIRILRSISSPYVVEYLGDGVTVAASGNCFKRNLYLEYLTGGTVVADLARTTNPGADVDERILRNYTFSIVSALKYLHSEGIVHCDIKGDNVLVVGPTNSSAAKLIDFGLAMAPRRRGGEDEIVKSDNGKIVPRGSPLWMAPEVIRAEYQGPESDVWSLGCTIIEMVNGKPAWEDKGAAATMIRIGYSDLVPELPTQLSELGRDFLSKCLRRDPKERWSSDQLLKHPFISAFASPENSATHQFTPRCILDWFSLDSDEDNEEERNRDDGICIARVKDRIRELASGTASPNWELDDGWTVVRSLESPDTASRCGGDDDDDEEEEAGTELTRVGSEIESGVVVDSTEIGLASGRTNEEYLLDSSSSPSEEENQNHRGDVVVSRNLGVGHLLLLLLFYLFSSFSSSSRENNNNICTQITILLRYTTIFWYIILSLTFFFHSIRSKHYYRYLH